MNIIRKFKKDKVVQIFYIRNFNFTNKENPNGKVNIIRLGNDDYKNFSKKFTPQEMEKYLDPYGFLNEYKDYSKEELNSIKNLKKDETLNQAKPELKDEFKSDKVEDSNKKVDSPIKNKLSVKEYGMKPRGPEPTRYGDWERNGKCVDF
jgi:hypothetical protein